MPNLFVYGTLLFPDVLHLVLERELDKREQIEATLFDHELCALPREVFPVIRAREGASTKGRLFRNLTHADLARLDYFESDFYERKKVRVCIGKEKVFAFVYVDSRKNHLPKSEWNPKKFQREDLTQYLTQVKKWMTDYVPNKLS